MILFTLGNFGQNKAFSLEILQNCVTLIGISMAKTKIIGNSACYSFNTPAQKFQEYAKNIWIYYFRGILKSFSCFIKVGILHKEIYNTMCVRACCFKHEFSELTGALSPQTSPGLIVLESMVEGRLSTVIPRPSTK